MPDARRIHRPPQDQAPGCSSSGFPVDMVAPASQAAIGFASARVRDVEEIGFEVSGARKVVEVAPDLALPETSALAA